VSKPFELGRYEMKYCLPVTERERILDFAKANILPDKHAQDISKDLGDALGRPPVEGARGYVVHSLYLDTPSLDDYTERLQDAKIRRRMRIRTYGAPGQKQPVYLEAKRKWEDRVLKVRVRLCDADTYCNYPVPRPWEGLAELMDPDYQQPALRFGKIVRDFNMQPVSCVHYVREVYVDPAPGGEKTRFTIDYGVTASIRPDTRDLYAKPDIELIPTQFMVLELKFDGAMPPWMREVVITQGLVAECVSKFGLSVALGLRGTHPLEVKKVTPITVLRNAA
jgi:hypothetical protein